MQFSLIVCLILALAWTAGSAFLGARLYRRRAPAGLHHDQFLMLVALASLAAAPWISVVVYFAGDRQTVLGGLVNLVVAAAVYGAALWVGRSRRRGSVVPGATISFRQKSALLMLFTLSVIYVAYALITWQIPALIIPLFFGSALLVALLASIGHAAIALVHAPPEELNEAEDERDRDAELAGSRTAYVVLAVGIWVVPVVALLQTPALVVANVAFLFVVLAQVVKYAAIVRFYQHGGA